MQQKHKLFAPLLALILFTFCNTKTNAQNLKEALPKTATSYAQICAFADSFYATNNFLQYNGDGVAQESDYLKYKRWQYYWQGRLMPDGSYPDPIIKNNIYAQLNNKTTRAGAWQNFSQTTTTSGYNGMGRVLSVAFHPSDTNTMWISAPKGGVWKTTNGGTTWAAKGDALPTLFTGKIICDATNPNNLYLSLGDNTYWVGTDPSLGIYKSTDAGNTWLASGLIYTHADNVRINDLTMMHNNGNIIFSAQSNGLFRSLDAGATWSLLQTGNYKQVKNKPLSASSLYAFKYDATNGNSKLYLSLDTGNSWTLVKTFAYNTSRVRIATTIADTNFVAAICVSDSTYLNTSNNSGTTWAYKGGQEDADYVGVSAINKNIIYLGGVSSYKSTNGGTNFNKLTHWYSDGVHTAVHADAHAYQANPITKKMFYCNDGGMYRYNEANDTWKDLSNGLIITQFYKCAISQLDSIYVMGGTQDNGGRHLDGGVWSATNGGDAMEQAMSIDDENVAFSTYVNGQLFRTPDRWQSDIDVTPDPNDEGSWITPYVVHPTKAGVMVAGYSKVYKSTDDGFSWVPISTTLAGVNEDLDCIAIARSNEETIYSSNGSKIYFTFNDGNTWANTTVQDGNSITEIYVHPKNNKILYLTKSGYSANKKVYKSIDGGLTFTNISFNLPNVPANTIIVDQESDSANVEIYIGTDVGVFYKKDLDANWQYYNTGLPNTEVSDLEIQYQSGILLASTYGRGLWKSRINRPLAVPLATNNIKSNTSDAKIIYNSNNIVLVLSNFSSNNLAYNIIDINGKIIEKINTSAQINNIINTQSLSSGVYFLQLQNANFNNANLKFVVK